MVHEDLEFILKHWDLVSEKNKRLLNILGISPEKYSHRRGYEKRNEYYKAREYER